MKYRWQDLTIAPEQTHHLKDGHPAYSERYAWCGNFQGGCCTVRHPGGLYFHLRPNGEAAYPQRYRYAGDYRDGVAVVQREDGLHTHINVEALQVHRLWILTIKFAFQSDNGS